MSVALSALGKPGPQHLYKWHDATSPAGARKGDRKSCVASVRLHLDTEHETALRSIEQEVSLAVGGLLQWLKDRLTVRTTADPTGSTSRARLHAADLVLEDQVVTALPPWTRGEGKSRRRRPQKPGTKPRKAPNLFAPETLGAPEVPKEPNAVRIAWGTARQGTDEEGKPTSSWAVGHLDAKFQLQQFFASACYDSSLAALPTLYRDGACQEAAQQLTSHLALFDSGTVTEAVFPTTEERDAVAQRRRWEEALERFCRSPRPCAYRRARELNPDAYAEDDPRGDRLVNVDPDWRVVMASPVPRRTPLLFVSGASVRLYRRIWRPDADPRTVRAGTYAAIPIGKEQFARLPAAVRAEVCWWRKDGVRETFSALLPPRQKARETQKPGTKPLSGPSLRTPLLLIPLSYGRKWSEQRIFRALTRLPIQWARIVHRSFRRGARQNREKWFLQLTIGYQAPTAVPTRVLGIHFGLDDLYHWAVVEDRGPGNDPTLVAEGVHRGNPILAHGLAKKAGVEWHQAKGRWVGGRVYGKELATDTHRVVNQMIRLAQEQRGGTGGPAGIGVEHIRWVEKRGPSSAANRRFSAWNYGQLRTFLVYKAPPAGVRFISAIYPKKTDRAQDAAEQARRIARKTLKRLHEQQKRAAQAAAQRAQEAHTQTEAVL